MDGRREGVISASNMYSKNRKEKKSAASKEGSDGGGDKFVEHFHALSLVLHTQTYVVDENDRAMKRSWFPFFVS